MAAKIKKGDKVVVLSGKDKGKQGVVSRVLVDDQKVVVSGVNMVSRHTKPTQADQGGIKNFEAPMHVSNVAHIDPRDGKPTRVGFKTDDNGRKVRVAKRSGEAIDV
ncbi:50S ribosomal protein L24 [Hirschia baltica]|uniref:Large ribosomal subunit protein uL24 n=1 Tax=Hirschia baltica (strain ATCC 49814 / DSM 5838 / IFAM 1418) TaxID=582402 RepID=C6XLF6_HIRBI|nr:50S ribosomal protein L24 [Hirschia baltica]ACT59755.1 ribosomal protein L24 [Hirschia baltica ATCC 49814]